MITEDKIRIYRQFNGDIDAWARIGTKAQKSVISDNDWFLIESFIQDINLIKKGIASKGFMKSIDERLKDNCDSQQTIQALKELAE